jgi:hypothetical protein
MLGGEYFPVKWSDSAKVDTLVPGSFFANWMNKSSKAYKKYNEDIG